MYIVLILTLIFIAHVIVIVQWLITNNGLLLHIVQFYVPNPLKTDIGNTHLCISYL